MQMTPEAQTSESEREIQSGNRDEGILSFTAESGGCRKNESASKLRLCDTSTPIEN